MILINIAALHNRDITRKVTVCNATRLQSGSNIHFCMRQNKTQKISRPELTPDRTQDGTQTESLIWKHCWMAGWPGICSRHWFHVAWDRTKPSDSPWTRTNSRNSTGSDKAARTKATRAWMPMGSRIPTLGRCVFMSYKNWHCVGKHICGKHTAGFRSHVPPRLHIIFWDLLILSKDMEEPVQRLAWEGRLWTALTRTCSALMSWWYAKSHHIVT